MRTRDGERIVRFIESCCPLTRGSAAGQFMSLRPWQRELVVDLAASGARRAYVQMPRKNGKSLLGAALALYNLMADGEEGAEVYSVAGSRDQARMVFDTASRMVALDRWLSRNLRRYRYEIVHPATGSKYKVIAAEAGHAEGLNPSCVIFDEVHVLGSDRRLWDTMNLGSGTREAPLVLGITTPGVRWGSDGRDSLAWTLYDYAARVATGEVEDEHFFSRTWEAPAGCDLRDETAWTVANPGLGDFLSVEDMEAACKTTPENEFRTKRLGQWVAVQAAWLPYGTWGACAEEADDVPAGTPVVLGFDGAYSDDSTALLGATVEAEPYVWVIGLWEKSPTAPVTWHVPHHEVDQAVLEACATWDVREVAADPRLWQRDLEAWARQQVPVVPFPQTAPRMIPAAQRFYDAVATGTMRHSGDPRLARHVGNTTVRPNGHLAKEHEKSGRKIDAAIAAVMAYERAVFHAQTTQRARVFVL